MIKVLSSAAKGIFRFLTWARSHLREMFSLLGIAIAWIALDALWTAASFRFPLIAKISAVSGALSQSSPVEPTFESFFALVGTIAVALWASAFAILALSRYTYVNAMPTTRLRLVREARRSADRYVNFWLMLQFAALSGSLLWTLFLSILMLFPKLTGSSFGEIAALMGLLNLGATLISLKYGADALNKAITLLEGIAERTRRISRWAREKEGRLGSREAGKRFGGRAKRVTRGVAKVMQALERYKDLVAVLDRGLTLHRQLGLSMPITLFLSLSLLWFPMTSYIAAVVIVMLVLGVVLLLRVGVKLFVNIPEILED